MTAQNFTALLLNLDRDTTRREHMEAQLAQAGITFTRLSGVLGDAVSDDLRPFFFKKDGTPKTRMKRGEIGCYASHLRALQRAASGGFGPAVLVMEDDLDLAPDFRQTVNAALRLLPKWDIVRLSCPSRRAYAPISAVGAGRLLVRYSKIPNSAGAYLISPDGARKFLQKGVRGLTYDDDLRRPWFHGLNTFGVLPPPVVANVMTSTIDGVETGRFDKGMSSRCERLLRGDHFYALNRLCYNICNMGAPTWLACTTINLVDMVARPVLGRSLIHSAAHLFPAGRKHG